MSAAGGVYYYTTLDTAVSILTGGEIWATNVAYMNDSSEYWFGMDRVEEFCQIRRENLQSHSTVAGIEDVRLGGEFLIIPATRARGRMDRTDYFPLCLTDIDPTGEQALGQWLTYAREGGVCLELDFDPALDYEFCALRLGQKTASKAVRLNLVRPTCATPTGSPDRLAAAGSHATGHQFGDWRDPAVPVSYMTKDGRVRAEADRVYSDDGLRAAAVVWPDRPWAASDAVFIKPLSFERERERRIVVEARPDLVRHQVRAGLAVPHVRLRVRRRAAPYGTPHDDGWPIKSVTVGPGVHQQRVFDSLKSLLNSPRKEDVDAPNDEGLLQLPVVNDRTVKDLAARLLGTEEGWASPEFLGRYLSQPGADVSSRVKAEYWQELSDRWGWVQQKWMTGLGSATSFVTNFDDLRRLTYHTAASYPEFVDCFTRLDVTRHGVILRRSDIPFVFPRQPVA